MGCWFDLQGEQFPATRSWLRRTQFPKRMKQAGSQGLSALSEAIAEGRGGVGELRGGGVGAVKVFYQAGASATQGDGAAKVFPSACAWEKEDTDTEDDVSTSASETGGDASFALLLQSKLVAIEAELPINPAAQQELERENMIERNLLSSMAVTKRRCRRLLSGKDRSGVGVCCRAAAHCGDDAGLRSPTRSVTAQKKSLISL
eukprot:TRINITY_DN22951_c0_g1_i1.p1 TRINITY_DN22951_c0_g1~~TRINITY_DN22951_c0_g1_i1.p1  ORF type:complete len:203 (-),score=26.24 TRINITY_DN22951_c0_g1_i1:510-1118(-)